MAEVGAAGDDPRQLPNETQGDTNANVLITVLCWPDGWPHGIWQACDDALQCA